MQAYFNEEDTWCETNHMKLNPSKSKDMVFQFEEKTHI